MKKRVVRQVMPLGSIQGSRMTTWLL